MTAGVREPVAEGRGGWHIEPMPLRGPLFMGGLAAYAAAFALPPYSDPSRGLEVRERLHGEHGARPGLRLLCAVLESGTVAGMTYGFRSTPGYHWHEAVRRVLGYGASRAWLSNAYELAEVAVDPRYQGLGLGSALIEELLAGCKERTCVLSTRADSRAHLLYRRLGFEELCIMPFRTNGAPFFVMGRVLP